VFRRKNPQPLGDRLRGWLWPSMGWQRLGRYLLTRLARLGGTPHSIAAGVACGVATSFNPFLGTHIATGMLLAYFLRGNYLAVVVGTLAGNPWTFPFMWLASYQLGALMLGLPLHDAWQAVRAFAHLAHDLLGLLWPLLTGELAPERAERLIGYLNDLIWPMALGSLPLGLAAGVVTYLPLARLIGAYQDARRRRRARRAGLELGPPGAIPVRATERTGPAGRRRV
jgi:hypothetical protein